MVFDAKDDLLDIQNYLFDTASNRPAAGTQGRLFLETDTGRTLYDNGSSWVEVGLSESQISLANLGSKEADSLDGNNGTSGQALVTDGSTASWGAPPVQKDVTLGSSAVEVADGTASVNPYTFSAVNIGRTLSAPAQTQDAVFNNDGTKLFIAGQQAASIFEYSLTTPYSIETATQTQSINSQANAGGLAFNDDGTKLFEIGDGTIYEYTLGTGFDISTASLNNSITAQSTVNGNILFNDDGTILLEIDRDVYEWSLGTAYDLSTASYTGTSFSTEPTDPPSGDWNADGTKLFLLGDNSVIYEYDLSTPYDISTQSLTSSTGVPGNGPASIEFELEGTKFFSADRFNDVVAEYDLEDGKPIDAIQLQSGEQLVVDSLQLHNQDFSTISDQAYVRIRDASSGYTIGKQIMGGIEIFSDGFEDGNYTSNLSWNVTTGESADVSVQTGTVNSGSNALQIQGDGFDTNAVSYTTSGGMEDGATYSVWTRRDNSSQYHRIFLEDGSSNARIFIPPGSGPVVASTAEGGSFGSLSNNDVTTGSWTRFEIQVDASAGTGTFRAFNSSGSLIGEIVGDIPIFSGPFDIRLQQEQVSPSTTSAFFDDISAVVSSNVTDSPGSSDTGSLVQLEVSNGSGSSQNIIPRAFAHIE